MDVILLLSFFLGQCFSAHCCIIYLCILTIWSIVAPAKRQRQRSGVDLRKGGLTA